MNTKKRITVRRLLSGALVLLGFTSCSNSFDEEIMRVEYGSPTAKFQVKGKVTTDTDEALKGIQVIVRRSWSNDPLSADTVYTDGKGEFKTDELVTGSIGPQKVYFNDIDGEENGGSFKSDSIALSDSKMEKKQLEEGSHWYVGKFEFSPKKPIKLSKKEKKPEE